MKVQGVDFIAYNVGDFKKGLAFYRDTLGLKVTSESDSWAEFEVGNVTLAIIAPPYAKEPGKGGAAVALSVDNVETSLQELKDTHKHINVIPEISDAETCTMAFIEDPWGNSIILHQRKDGTVG